MATDKKRTFSTRHTYAITLLLGLAFCLTLVKSAWDSTIDRKRTEFQYDILSIEETVSRNVLSGNDVTNNVAAFVSANETVNSQQFEAFAGDVLVRYPHLESINYFQFDGDNTVKRYPLTFQLARDKSPLEIGHDIYLDFQFRNVLDSAISSGAVVPTPPNKQAGKDRKYWLFKAIYTNPYDELSPGSYQDNLKGVVGILVSPAKTLGDKGRNSKLTITMFSDTVNLYGRKLLYLNEAEADVQNSKPIESFVEEELIHLPPYSIKIIIEKDIFLRDLDFDLVFASVLLGVGILLLMLGLMKTKLQQERELKERNQLIEKQVEEQTYELAIARDEAIQAVKMKSEFLASMSHEIRTPLNAIIGMSDLMSETELTEEQERYVTVFRKAGDALLSLVNDILDLSKIEAGQIVLERIPLNLSDILEEVADIYALKAADKNLEIITRVDTGLNEFRLGDPGRLKQVILNLISNALKFTEQGQIVISLNHGLSDNNKDSVLISVRDTGIGIPPDKQEAIFESFTQADASTTRRFGGTGLGLTICRHLISLMGGTIRVESEVDKGSEFFVELELEQISQKRELPPDLHDKKILLADTRIDNCLAFEETLKSAGANCVTATTSEHLLGFLCVEDKPDILLLDSNMLLENREQLQPCLNNQLKSRSLVTVTPKNMSSHPEIIDKEGFYKTLIKPVKRKELFESIRSMFDKGYRKQDLGDIVKTDNDQSPDKVKHILLVEDNPDNRMLIRAYLKKTAHVLEEAENGEIAVDKFSRKKYDLVFMDIQMPVMDGHEATKRIRQWEKENSKEKTPIIALTAHAIKEEIDKCLASGCDSHLGKPVKKATLLQTIDETY